MRAARQVFAVALVLIIGLAAKQYFYPPLKAAADPNAIPHSSLDILRLQRDVKMKSLPQQIMSEKTFVFDGE